MTGVISTNPAALINANANLSDFFSRQDIRNHPIDKAKKRTGLRLDKSMLLLVSWITLSDIELTASGLSLRDHPAKHRTFQRKPKKTFRINKQSPYV
jgi:hypothetical protein